MKFKRKRETAPIEIPPIRLETIHVDHRIIHEYQAKPRPKDIEIRLYNQENGQMWMTYISFPGQKTQIPAYALNLSDDAGKTIEMQVIW